MAMDGTRPLRPAQEWLMIGAAFLGLFLVGFGGLRMTTKGLPVTEMASSAVSLEGCSSREERDSRRRAPDDYWLVLTCEGGRRFVYADTFGSYPELRSILTGSRTGIEIAWARAKDETFPKWLEDGDPIIEIRRGGEVIRSRDAIEGSYTRSERFQGAGMLVFGAFMLGGALLVGWMSDRMKKELTREQTP